MLAPASLALCLLMHTSTSSPAGVSHFHKLHRAARGALLTHTHTYPHMLCACVDTSPPPFVCVNVPGTLLTEKTLYTHTSPLTVAATQGRTWTGMGSRKDENERIDFSEGAPPPASAFANGAAAAEALGASRMEEEEGDWDSEDEETQAELAAAAEAAKGKVGARVWGLGFGLD